MSIFSPARSQIDSLDNFEIIVQNRSIPSYYHCFPPDRSDTDSCGSSPPKQFSIPSYYHFFPPDMSDTDSYGSSTPNHQFSIPSLHFPPNDSETDNSSLVINGISLDERIFGGIVGIDSLDEKIKKCIQAVKILRSKSVYDLMFTCTDSDLEIHFNKALLNFSEAVALGGISPGNLFRILDTYDVMAKVRLKAIILDNFNISQARATLTGRKTQTPTELEHKQNGILKKLMQSCHIHPLTEAMMNYVKLIVDDDQLDALRNHDSNSLKMNPLASQLLELINLLEFSFEKESKFYGKGGLQYIFLMNNILYIDQKVKDLDLGGLLGDNWDRKQHKQTRQYAMSYLRASWTKVLDCLNDRGIPWSSSSKASTVALQERLKNFNTCFEEICRVQTAWEVLDAQLRKELRTSISEMVIPAYRSFMGRFGNQVESGRHAEKYIEYTADDLESYLFNLFEGVPRVLHRRRRKEHRIKQDSHEGLELRTLVSIKPPVMGRVKRVLIQFNKA